jgi:hypothetical protein
MGLHTYEVLPNLPNTGAALRLAMQMERYVNSPQCAFHLSRRRGENTLYVTSAGSLHDKEIARFRTTAARLHSCVAGEKAQ